MADSDVPVSRRLFAEPWVFDFFQAVRLLGRLPEAQSRVDPSRPFPEVARFRALASLAFPASAIYDLTQESPGKLPVMTVTFLGLFGPSGVLPHHYTYRIIERERTRPRDWDQFADSTRAQYDAERRALRDWLDLFNHRFTFLFQRAWEKYRFFIAQERGGPDLPEPDAFTRGLLSLAGLGTPGLGGRLQVAAPGAKYEPDRVFAKVHDLGLLRFTGLFAQQHRNPWGLGVLLEQYFRLPVDVRQFQGQWLPLEQASQSRLGEEGGNGDLGLNTVAGDRVWDVQGKIRIRLGPLRYAQFLDYLPDLSPVPERKSFFLLAQVTRLYVGPELDFDVQLVLKAPDVPACQLNPDRAAGPRLGWNCWLLTGSADADTEDAVFPGVAVTRVGDGRRSGPLSN